jgi:hypothetical protein
MKTRSKTPTVVRRADVLAYIRKRPVPSTVVFGARVMERRRKAARRKIAGRDMESGDFE